MEVSPVLLAAERRWEWPELITLPDGAAVELRAARPGDSARLERMFYRLSPDTIYFWTFVPAHKQPHWAARFGALAQIDYYQQYAVVAMVNGEVVGLARFDREATPGQAEVAIVIEDAWQRRGLGRQLMYRLIEAARRLQITTFTARILGENRRTLRLVAMLFAEIQTEYASGECLVRCRLASHRLAGPDLPSR